MSENGVLEVSVDGDGEATVVIHGKSCPVPVLMFIAMRFKMNFVNSLQALTMAVADVFGQAGQPRDKTDLKPRLQKQSTALKYWKIKNSMFEGSTVSSILDYNQWKRLNQSSSLFYRHDKLKSQLQITQK